MAGVLYLVTSYRSPDQVLRLAETISRESPGAGLLVHHDQFRTRLDATRLRQVAPGANLLTSPRPLRWGDFSVVDMHWRCFEWASSHIDFDWLVMLSEQDYPVWPLERTEKLLREADSDVFVEADVVEPSPEGATTLAYNRYFYSYAAAPGAAFSHRLSVPWSPAWRSLRQRAVNRVNRRPGRLVRAETYPDGMPTRFGIRRASTPFSESFRCWVGKAWFAVSRRAVGEIVSFTRSHPSYRRYCRWTIVPEESATVSIVMNAPSLRTTPRNLHFERWSDPYSGHPDLLGRDDLEEIIGSGMPFARKFDLGVDPGVLELLDRGRLRA